MSKALLKYYKTFIEHLNDCHKLIVAALNECYYWLVQSFEESKGIACSFKELVNGYELSCLSDLVKTSIEVNGGSIEIAFRGFIFVPEHASGSEMSLFNIVYELSENGEKLHFDNPLGEPCETSEDEAINTFLDMLFKIFKLCEERS
jgi:hypothetical protein